MTNEERAYTARLLAIAATVKGVGEGPTAPMYQALQKNFPGMPAWEFSNLIETLVNARAIRRVGSHQVRWINNVTWNEIIEKMDEILRGGVK